MDSYTAVSIVEGFAEEGTEEEVIDGWQYLIDTGICWQLQGRFGRQAWAMIEAGVCHLADEQKA